MKKIILIIAGVIFCFNLHSSAQVLHVSGSQMCSEKKMSSFNPFLAGINSTNTPKHKFDVLNYKLNFDVRSCFFSPYPKSYSAYEIIKFRVDTALNLITLDAINTSLVIDSVRMSGTTFSQTATTLTINLDRTYNPNEIDSVKIYFRHLNVSDVSFYANQGMIFTDCEPQGARYWFPCWDAPGDKATIDLTAKVPSNAKLGSNGRLNDSLVTGDTAYYHWISRDPVSTYLVTMIGKINFNLDIVYWHKNSNPIDSVPIRFYYSAGENPSQIETKIVPMTTYYSRKFCDMPFEKNGMASIPSGIAPWCGGMENQTLINFLCAIWDENLTSHEYAHQWFGDMITCGTWADIWLNEGFATYCEALWYENTGGYTSYKSAIVSDANNYLSSNPGWAIYNPPMNNLFNYAITYAKGSCVLHMLRYTIGSTQFFNFLRAYAADTANFKYGTAVTDDFATKLSQVVGQDMTWFIDEWVKQPNHPQYQNIYSFIPQGGGNWEVEFFTSQVQTNTTFHKMPLVVKISFATGGDTSISVMNDTNDQTWSWMFDRQPSAFAFDPNNDIVLKTATTTVGIPPLSKQMPLRFSLSQNYPNPFNPVTRIFYAIPKRSNVSIKIFNVLGQLIGEPLNSVREPGNYWLDFDGSSMPSGVYFYVIRAGNFTDQKKMVLIK